MVVAKAVHRFSRAGSRGSGDYVKAAVMLLEGRSLLFDSSVALVELTRCANSGAEMDEGCAVIRLLLAQLQADAWWEYVQSNSNWPNILAV